MMVKSCHAEWVDERVVCVMKSWGITGEREGGFGNDARPSSDGAVLICFRSEVAEDSGGDDDDDEYG